MGNERISSSMSTIDVVKVMSEGNPGAIRIVMTMLGSLNGFLNLLDCDHLDIRGSKLFLLFNDCCGNDMDRFE